MIQTKTKDKDVIENCLNYCYYYFDKFPTKKKNAKHKKYLVKKRTTVLWSEEEKPRRFLPNAR